MAKSKIISQHKLMIELLKEVEIIRHSDCPVLIVGETGTGKEILADYIFKNSPRSDRRFVKVSLSSLPSSLFESELFGHERGAYTGADKSQAGFFEAANNATIFLDDIDDFPLHLQPKLLRVIENKELIRIGANDPIPSDVRILTSSKVELKELVDKGIFRSDLFYRLSVFRLYIPPLRERKSDIPYLLNHFISLSEQNNKALIDSSMLNLQPLYDYNWKGNVRELRNFADKLLLYPQQEINDNFEKIFESFVYGNNGNKNHDDEQDALTSKKKSHKHESDDSFDEMVENYEKKLTTNALKKSFGNVNLASRLLKIKASTLRDKVKRYKLDTVKYKK